MSSAVAPRIVSRSPARGRARNAALTELRRHDILAAAVKVFGRKGFAQARAEDIAAAAKIAKGTLYLYFRSKEAIYTAAISLAVRELQQTVDARSREAQSAEDKLRLAILVRLDFWLEQASLFRLLLTLGREPRHRRHTQELLRSGQVSLKAILCDGVRTGELPPGDFDTLAWALLDMIRGVTERRIDGVDQGSAEAQAEALTRIVMRAVCAG